MREPKIFATDARGYVFMGDPRDIAIAYSKRQEVYEWCGKNKIAVEYRGTLAGTDLWRVRDDAQRAWFSLRWS